MKLKKVFSGLLLAVGITTVLGTSLYVSKADSDGDWVYSTSEPGYKGCVLTGYTGTETEVTVPYKVNGIPVDTVKIRNGSDESNENLKNVKKVTFGSGYEKMNNTAITGFENVEELVIPDTVTVIKDSAFVHLKNLKSVQLPSSLRTIEDNAFSDCKSLESITVPEGVVKIEWCAFEDCSGLKSVSLPKSLEEMEYGVFSGCTGLKDENGMIIVNDRLYRMDIPAGTTEITIPDGIKVLEVTLFYDIKSIKKVIIPDSVIRIEYNAFKNCSNLEEVVMSDNVECSGGAFSGCEKLQDENGFVIVNGVLFNYYGTENDITIPDGVKAIDSTCFINKPITSVKMPDSLISIGNNAFAGCSGLTKIEVPDSVTQIGISAFERCSSLSEVKLSKNVKVLDFCLFENDINLKKLTIPDGTETIKAGAFRGSGVEELILPASLKLLQNPGWKEDIKITYKGTPEQWGTIEKTSGVNIPDTLVFAPPTPMPTTAPTVTSTPAPTETPVPTATSAPVATTVPEATVTVTPEATSTPAATAAPTVATEVTATPTAAPTAAEASPVPTAEPTLAVTAAPAADSFKVNGNTYKIQGKTATLVKGANKAKVSIPATVKFKGKKYKVTEIGASAFKSNKKLKSVTIGKNVKVIGKQAFYKDTKLGSVTIKSKLLKASKVGKSAFKGLSKSVVFKVPASKKKTYSKIVAKSLKKYKIK